MAAGKLVLEYLVDKEPRAGPAWTERKPIAEVVEHQLLVGAIGDITRISALPLLEGLPVLDQAYAEAKRIEDRRELFGVAACQIVVDRDDMNRTAHERGGNRRQHRRQGLAFAGFHFGERAAHQGGTAQQLNMEVTHSDMSASHFARKRE
jgi:hypothetical protein